MNERTTRFPDDARAARNLKTSSGFLARRLCMARLRIQALKDRNRRLSERHRELERTNQRLADFAWTDDLTGLKNRRHFREALENCFEYGARRRMVISLVIADLDHFKSYNDTFGHLAGDALLRRVATILRANARAEDEVARYGGDEFVLLLPGTDGPGARQLAERLSRDFERDRQALTPFTASFGIATTTPQSTESACSVIDERFRLIEDADRALYHSKGVGRNWVTHSHDLPEERLVSNSFPRIA